METVPECRECWVFPPKLLPKCIINLFFIETCRISVKPCLGLLYIPRRWLLSSEFSFPYVLPPSLSRIDDPVTPFTLLSFLLLSCTPFSSFSFSPLTFCLAVLQVSRADPHGPSSINPNVHKHHSTSGNSIHKHHDHTTGNTIEKRQGTQGLYTVLNCLRFQACL